MGMRSTSTTGGAYERRGAFYIRISVAPQKRIAERARLATSLEEATERARVIQGLVNRLRAAGKVDFIARLVELGASADGPKLAELGRVVDGLLSGVIVRKKLAHEEARKLSVQSKAWERAVTPLYDSTTVATLAQYAIRWGRFFGDDLATVDAPSLARYMSARLSEVTRSTVKKELWGLGAFLRWSHEQGAIATVPAFPKLPKRATGVRSGRQRAKAVELTPEHVEAILEAMSERARPRYAFAAATGLRPETIDRLSVPEHFEPGSDVLNIAADIDKNRFERQVNLSPRALAVLDAVAPESGLIFGKQRWLDDFKAAVASAGLPKETAPYDLRHAFATHALRASGSNLQGVAYLLGHKQVTTTNRYVHATQAEAARVLDQLHGGSGGKSRESSPKAAASSRDHTGDDEEDAFRFQCPQGCKGSSPFLRTSSESQGKVDVQNAPTDPEPDQVPPHLPPEHGGTLAAVGHGDPVERALADALTAATSAGQWDVVAQLARELQARREATSAPNVVRLTPSKRGAK